MELDFIFYFRIGNVILCSPIFLKDGPKIRSTSNNGDSEMGIAKCDSEKVATCNLSIPVQKREKFGCNPFRNSLNVACQALFRSHR